MENMQNKNKDEFYYVVQLEDVVFEVEDDEEYTMVVDIDDTMFDRFDTLTEARIKAEEIVSKIKSHNTPELINFLPELEDNHYIGVNISVYCKDTDFILDVIDVSLIEPSEWKELV